MFGKGVYFADSMSKSLGYCWDHSQASGWGWRQRNNGNISNVRCLLLCEVALGNMQELWQAKYVEPPLPEGVHSTFGRGTQGPNYTTSVTTPFGVTIPTGKIQPFTDKRSDDNGLEQSPALANNEYIVYDEAQVVIKYLVMLDRPRDLDDEDDEDNDESDASWDSLMDI